MKEYAAPQMVKIQVNSREAFSAAASGTCIVEWGNTLGAAGCCEGGSGPLNTAPSDIGCSSNLITP